LPTPAEGALVADSPARLDHCITALVVVAITEDVDEFRGGVRAERVAHVRFDEQVPWVGRVGLKSAAQPGHVLAQVVGLGRVLRALHFLEQDDAAELPVRAAQQMVEQLSLGGAQMHVAVAASLFGNLTMPEAGAYATGILAMMVSWALAVTVWAFRPPQARRHSRVAMLTVVLGYALVVNIIEKPDDIAISGLFIAGIILVSLISRVSRATGPRVGSIEFG
jgi:hypothetical protein